MYRSGIVLYRLIVQYTYYSNSRKCRDIVDENLANKRELLRMISLNSPDAHNKSGSRLIRYEIAVMRFMLLPTGIWSWLDETEDHVPQTYLIMSEHLRRMETEEGE